MTARGARILALGAALAAGLAGRAPAEDILTLASGEAMRGTARGFDGKRLRFAVRIGQGQAESAYDAARIAGLELGRAPEEQKLLDETPSAAAMAAVEAFAKRREPYLALPGTDAPEVFARWAEGLLVHGDEAAAKRALELVDRALKAGPGAGVRTRLEGLRLRALAKSGDTEAAANAAAKMSELSSEDAASLVEAKFQLAEGALATARRIEAEHPRWSEVRDLARERARSLDAALDGFLYPVAFHAADRAACARGLWRAAELHLAEGRTHAAAACAREIVEHFPEPAYAGKARAVAADAEETKENTK